MAGAVALVFDNAGESSLRLSYIHISGTLYLKVKRSNSFLRFL